MNRRNLQRAVTVAVSCTIAGAAVACATDSAEAASISRPADPATAAAPYRQLLGRVTETAYLEASVPSAGRYVIEYDVSGVAIFDTYLNATELGYVGGPTGIYRTHAVPLTAGGQLLEVVGPEGSGTASVYIVRVD